jgi:hypothetical protein
MKQALIIGNGNSSKLLLDHGFHNIPEHVDSYCCSLAFRFCEALNWWPEYYVSLDPKTNFDQAPNFQRFISDVDNPVLEWHLRPHADWPVQFNDPQKKIIPAKGGKTAVGAFELAWRSGKYDRVMMIGMDNNSWWDGTLLEQVAHNRFKYIKDVDKHPMYFWPGYVTKGDIVTWNFREREQKKYHENVPKNFQSSIDEAIQAGIEVIDFSDNKMNTKKSKDISNYLGT